MSTDNQIFENISKYITLTDQDISTLKSCLKSKKMEQDDYLLHPGQVATYDSYVKKGAMKAAYINREGQEYILHFAIEDWWITDFESFINQTPAKLTITALEESELQMLSYASLQKLFKLNSKFEHFYRLMNERHTVTLFNTIISLLSNDAEQRYLRFTQKYPGFMNRLPQYEIASFLNISPEHLSRIRRKLSKK